MSRVPDFVRARDDVIAELLRFEHQLRERGVTVPSSAGLSAAEALATVGLSNRDSVAVALRATMVSAPDDLSTFDELFSSFWDRLRDSLSNEKHTALGADRTAAASEPWAGATDRKVTNQGPTNETGQDGRGGSSGEPAESRAAERPASDTDNQPDAWSTDSRAGTATAGGTSRTITTGENHPGETVEEASLRRLASALSTQPGRRWKLGDGRQIDWRQSIRSSLNTGGAVFPSNTRERRSNVLRTSIVVDVSESVLDAIDRPFLLSVLSGLVEYGGSVRIFFFDTDIREVTDAFDEGTVTPLSALEAAEFAWGGGTRIGNALATLRRQWPGAVDRRAVTVIISDGLEAGEVDTLAREMAWLSRRSSATLWFNPLAVSTDYSPTCRGMAAALPFVDGLFAFGGPTDIAEIARQLERHGTGGPIGYKYDFRSREPLTNMGVTSS